MKFSAVLLATFASTASAFSAVSPNAPPATPVAATGPSTDPVDKSLTGIDDDLSYDSFDPLSGDAPALTRNNKDEVLVSQVCICMCMCVFILWE